MTIRIESRQDLSGAMLVIRFPEKDVDKKALYTIQADWPDFLIPFRYRSVDGEAECTYQLGSQSKLLYRCSSRTPGELVSFWERVLRPLLDCGDWFLKPFSFVMDPQYLFLDKDGETISYLYVPAKGNCSDLEILRVMVVELSQKNPSTDAQLEVKVLRSIMQDFQPKAFLTMLRETQPGVLTRSLVPQQPQIQPQQQVQPSVAEKQESVSIKEPAEAPHDEPAPVPAMEDGEIRIDLSGSDAKKEKRGLFGNKGEKKKNKEKAREKTKEKSEKKKEGGLFGKKKEEPAAKEIVLGAAAEESAPRGPVYSVPVVVGSDEDDGITTIPEEEATAACFRLVGDATMPRSIPVSLELGGIFTIGRFDVALGRQQSSFEFPAKTKAVSRHHAAVERTAEGYTLVDLGSSTGTYLQGKRLTPNVPRFLERGCRVAFGTAGADYVWEE